MGHRLTAATAALDAFFSAAEVPQGEAKRCGTTPPMSGGVGAAPRAALVRKVSAAEVPQSGAQGAKKLPRAAASAHKEIRHWRMLEGGRRHDKQSRTRPIQTEPDTAMGS
jgi:hypothetical protein